MKEINEYYIHVKLPNGTYWDSKRYPTPEDACVNIGKIVAHYGMRYTNVTIVRDTKWVKEEGDQQD